MIAALRFRSSGTYKSNEPVVHLSGTVFDTNHNPLCDVQITWNDQKDGLCTAKTDKHGNYSIDIAWDAYVDGVGITAYKKMYWYQTYTPYYDGSENLRFNYTLMRAVNITAPIGPVVLATINDGSTRIEKTTYICDYNETFLRSCFGATSADYLHADLFYSGCYSRLFSEVSERTSLSYAVLNYTVVSSYPNVPQIVQAAPNQIAHIGSQFDNESSFEVKSLLSDYLEPEYMANDTSAFYSLKYGESATITIRNFSYSALPDYFSSEVQFDLGKFSHGDYFLNSGIFSNNENRSYASVTITPLTEGTHLYQAYVEAGLIIHVWEIK